MWSQTEFADLVRNHLLRANDVTRLKWRIAESPLGGRGVFATGDIQIGETIFVDHPLLSGPRVGNLLQVGCVVCCKIVDQFVKCPACDLRLCSEDCEHSYEHRKDCDVISKWCRNETKDEAEAILSKALTAIRSLRLSEENKLFLSLLAAHVLPPHGREIDELKSIRHVPNADETFMKLACCVLDANAFQIATEYGAERMSLRGLYPVAALLNHACVANTRHSFEADRQMVVRAAKFIPAGAEVFTCYSGLLWGTAARRHHLYKTKHFWCNCERCMDPTEYGTNLSSLKCFSTGCPGSLLPREPLKMTSIWMCKYCLVKVSSTQVGTIQSALASLLGTLNFEDPCQIEDYLVYRLTKYIPKSNQIYVDLQCRLVWIVGDVEGHRWTELSTQRLALKERLCRELLALTSALRAGAAHLRGLLLYHLHAALAERARRDTRLYQELKAEIESAIDEAYVILQGDVSAPSDLALRRRYLGSISDIAAADRFSILET